MLCTNCVKLAFVQSNKSCIRCQGNVNNNISVLCDSCSSSDKKCSVCLKKIVPVGTGQRRGCNCGR